MRILLLPHRYPPHGRGGVETWTGVLGRALLAAGHDVTVLTRDDRDPSDPGVDRSVEPPFSRREERPPGDPPVHRLVHRLADARGYRSTWDDPRFDAPIATLLEAVRPDVLHLAHPDGWGRRPLEIARARGIPTVVTLHDYKWICGRGQMVRPPGRPCARVEESRCARCLGAELGRGPAVGVALGVLDRLRPGDATALRSRFAEADAAVDVDARRLPGPRALRRWRDRQGGMLRALAEATAVTSPSRWVADVHRRSGLDRDIRVIRQGLPPAPPPGPRRPGPLRVGWFGTPTPTKGLGFLLRAVAALPEGSVELHAHGVDDAGLSGAAGTDGVPAAAVAHGRYPPGEAVARMATVDVVAIPSQWDENAPMVAIEARWARRPLLVSARGGLPELVRDGVDGWVAAADDPAAWAERIARCAARPAVAAEAAGRAPPPRTDGEMAEEYEAVYATALGASA